MQKVVLVTGGTSGIGQAICKVLSLKGYLVYGTGRKVENDSVSGTFRLLKMDVNDIVSVRSAIDYLLAKENRIDVLVNNAGLGMAGAVEDSLVKEMLEIFNTNVAGIIRTSQCVLPSMREKKAGLIINISSVGGLMGLPYRGIYSASKSALETISESMSQEVMQFGVKVVLVEPGDFSTSINENRKVPLKAETSVYKDDFKRINKLINHEVSNGDNPKKIGELIHKIINKRKPALRYNVGNFTSKLALSLKRLLPNRWFETMMMNHYKMKRKPD